MKFNTSFNTYNGDGAITERTVQKWFSRFRGGNFNLSDMERTGHPGCLMKNI